MRYLMLALLLLALEVGAHDVYFETGSTDDGEPIARVMYDHGWCEFYYGYQVVPVRSGQWYPYPTDWDCGH